MRPAFIPKELTGKALFKFIVDNEKLIEHTKKSAIKYADGLFTPMVFEESAGGILVSKDANIVQPINEDATKLAVDLCINTTNYFDSHYDVHIDGIWNKNLRDNKGGYYLLDKHQNDFKAVIGEGLKGRVAKMSWKDLGFDYTGVTEALMFKGTLFKERNEYMFGQYVKRYVKQHSVGMEYVKLVTCVNDDDWPVQKENWDKYFPMVINQKDAEEAGFFWAILEAKVREGSAVLFGSNCLTPSYYVEESKSKLDDSTAEEPVKSTLNQPPTFDILEAIRKTTFLK